MAIGSAISKLAATGTTSIKIIGLTTDRVNEVMEELRTQLGLTEEEFLELMENNTLKDKIEKELSEVRYHNKEFIVIDDNGKGYRLDNKGQWKNFDINKDKLTISKDLEEFAKQNLGEDSLSDDLKETIAYTQCLCNISDEQWKNFVLHPKVTQEMLKQAVKEELEKEAEEQRQKELDEQKEKDKDKNKDDDDNVHRHR